MIESMSRKGNCWDNAPMESCFGTIKTELVHHTCYPTREAARHDLFAYIEGYYNRQQGAFRPRVYHSRTGKAPSRLIRCPLNQGKVISDAGFDPALFKPASPNNLSEPRGVVAISLICTTLQRRIGVPGVQAIDRRTFVVKLVP